MRFIPLEKLINMHDGYRREFTVDYHKLLLLQFEGERFLVEARCPHLEHPLIEAWLENPAPGALAASNLNPVAWSAGD